MALEGPALRSSADLGAARRGGSVVRRRDLEAVPDRLDGRQHQGVGAAGTPPAPDPCAASGRAGSPPRSARDAAP